jgi:hypothetical protein
VRFVRHIVVVSAAAAIACASGAVHAQPERVAPEVPTATTPIVDGGSLAGPTLGQRLQLTSEARTGVATFVGTRYSLIGHEGRPEVAVSAAVEKHLGRTLFAAEAVFARELAEDQRDAEIAVAALHSVTRRFAVGVAGRATIDLDDGRGDGGEVRWESRGGAAASVHLGRALLALHAGAVAMALPGAIRAGPFALAAVGGWF